MQEGKLNKEQEWGVSSYWALMLFACSVCRNGSPVVGAAATCNTASNQVPLTKVELCLLSRQVVCLHEHIRIYYILYMLFI